jgi:subtilisin family serine protease
MDDSPVLALAIEGEDAEVEMFLSTESSFSPLAHLLNDLRFVCATPSHNISLPGTLPSAVTVGALNCRESFVNAAGETIEGWGKDTPLGTIADFSSIGPTRDGRIKPDVVAPGVNIISAGSSFHEYSYGEQMVTSTVFQHKTYPWCVMSGTSMATPCVAGIVALWLQANPQLTPEGVKEIIKATSKKPEESMEYPNNTYGYGLIDAYAGIKMILKDVTGIENVVTTAVPNDGWYTLSGTHINGKPAAKGIYIHQGRKIVIK